MTAALLALQALWATAILPPAAPPPRFVATPTAAARALSVAGVRDLPDQPVGFTFQCLVYPDGRLGDCIRADDGGTTNVARFRERLAVVAAERSGSPSLHAALSRISYYRIAPTEERRGAPVRSLLVREAVAPGDAGPADAPAGQVAPADLTIEQGTGDAIADSYPPAALRAGLGARVVARCRVLTDRSLLCRDPRVTLPPAAIDDPQVKSYGIEESFARATLRAFAAMRVQPVRKSGGSALGQEVDLALNWRLPE